MNTSNPVAFRKMNFEITADLGGDAEKEREFCESIYRIRPSRLEAIVMMEIIHYPTSNANSILADIVRLGIKGLDVRTAYPVPGPIANNPHAHMQFTYRDGCVIEQYLDLCLYEEECQEFMVSFVKVLFQDLRIIDCNWDENAGIRLIAGIDVEKKSED